MARTGRPIRFEDGIPLTVVPCMAPDLPGLVSQARAACDAGADMVEWRADFASCLGDAPAMGRLLAGLRRAVGEVPVLATVRTEAEGGAARLAPQEYKSLLLALCEAGLADAVDVELASGGRTVGAVAAAAHAHGMLAVASRHRFDGPLAAGDVRLLLEQMRDAGADVCKVAFMADGLASAQAGMAAISAFATQPGNPAAVGIAMGEHGAITRVAGGLFGSVLAFASVDGASAPGQLSLPQTAAAIGRLHAAAHGHKFAEFASLGQPGEGLPLVALLGSPVGHSLSPAIHNLAFSHAGLRAFYAALDCTADDVGAAVQAMKEAPQWVGANVTMPCKQAVLAHLDGADDATLLVGAANTIRMADGQAFGHNTDGVGFVASLHDAGVGVVGKHVFVVGAGGAAQAVAAQCALDGAAHVTLACRAGSKRASEAESFAQRVADRTACAVEVCAYDHGGLADAVGGADVLVNATPVGMGAQAGESPVPPEALQADMAVADLVYHPRRTLLLRQAAERGCTTVEGIGMLLHQAAEAQRIWFGARPDAGRIARELGL